MSKEKKTRYVVLGLLTHESMTGYDIKKTVETQLSFFWSESYGQIYPTLAELEEEGLITLREEPGAVPRKVYSLLPAGEAELRKWLAKPVDEEKMRYEILLKTSLADPADYGELAVHIRDFRRRQELHLLTMREFEQNLRTVLKENPQHTNILLTVLCGKRVYQAFVDWCDEALEILAQTKTNRA